MPQRPVTVCLEVAPKKTFASALDWPGWTRAGRDEAAALEALAAYAHRYAPVAREAGIAFPTTVEFAVVERLKGNAATEFGVPEMTASAERERVTPATARRTAALVTAAWTVFDGIVAVTPEALRKGPRGGGRDRDKMVDHVLGAEAGYARKLGIRLRPPALDDVAAIEELREAIVAVLGAASDGGPVVANGWTTRYAARRIAWHALDHAWEMQDRTP